MLTYDARAWPQGVERWQQHNALLLIGVGAADHGLGCHGVGVDRKATPAEICTKSLASTTSWRVRT
jgi:hypothetical protein